MKSKTGFLYYLYIGLKWRKTLVLYSFIICLLTVGISFIIPKWFNSRAVILPPADDSNAIGFSSIMKNLPFGSVGLGSMSDETTLAIAIVNSRTMMESVINEFGLIKRYRAKNIERAIKTLRHRVSAEINEDGTITISVYAKTPYFPSKVKDNEARKLSRDITDYIVKNLDIRNIQFKADKARNTRLFIEKRYLQNIDDLHSAENALKDFQDKYGAIALPEQITATISAAAGIEGQIVAKEIELKIVEQYAGASNFEVISLKNEINALKSKFNEMNRRQRKEVSSDKKDDIFLPLNSLPDLALKYARLYRAVKIQETIQEFLLPQYEQAKIQEVKDTPTIQVLDEAVLPIEKAKPKRALLVIFAGILSFSILFFYAVMFEKYIEIREKNTEVYQKINSLFMLLKNKNN